ncbi:hypothetical protein FE782_14200 [Paenibacillus antri]|uniref:Uncharacterized protein n=1 Tax=Paenibacillus antri TaxID=2582848 RepID=A0A5R9G993_9BACL|nr:hypothetical protein [Paenibacillus antri]TLS51649.1 hypothetical protein FE782_14200 [Paenibacillus antri]
MSEPKTRPNQPTLGLQGPVVAWHDPWAKERSDDIMRTGTGIVYPSQEPAPTPGEFVRAMQELGAAFYVHHLIPSLAGQSEMIRDLARAGMRLCLGNEYGNINGPYVEGTNRYDVPDETLAEAARAGILMGALYDEPEHLQINAGQYRKDAFLPHWGATDGLSLAEASDRVASAVERRALAVRRILEAEGLRAESAPLVSEQVFSVLFHVQARGGMAVCPKVMKESFQPLQLATALGAAKQYGRDLWICADLWGPDVGPWFTRTSGFPGHSPEEFASALRMGYLMAPTHLFAENIDCLLRHEGGGRFRRTAFGDAWEEFARRFVPSHPLDWSHRDAEADIAFVHADDSNYGQNARLFGNRSLEAPVETQSVFHVWHLLSRGAIPSHGSCMHIPGYDFPRHRLKKETPIDEFPLENGREWGRGQGVHPLFLPSNNVLVYDETVTEERLGAPRLIVAAGTRLSPGTLDGLRRKANDGALVVIASWLAPEAWRSSGRVGSGRWLATDDFLGDERVREAIEPFLGPPDRWSQRFGDTEVRFAKGDAEGFTLEFEIARLRSR